MAKCCDFSAGILREPVEFQRQQKSDIGGGASEVSYVTRCNVRASFRSLSGGERFYANRLDATTKKRIVLRYRSDIVDSDRVIVRGRMYQIRFIDNVELRNKWLIIDLDGGVAT